MSSIEEDIDRIMFMMDVNLMHNSKARFRRVLNELRNSSVAEQRVHHAQVTGPVPATNQQEQA